MKDGTPKNKKGGKREGAGRKRIELVQFKDLPAKQIVLDQVLYWINLQATAEEIAGSFYVSVDTLYRRLKEDYGFDFAELYKRTEGGGKLSLRKHQFDLSKRSAAMGIWLGKQWLGQKDNDEDKYRFPPNHDLNNKDIEIAKLQNETNELKAKLDALLAKTSQVDSGSNPSI